MATIATIAIMGASAGAGGLVVADWAVVGAYLAATVLIAVLVRRRASRSGTDFFLAGRSLPWWIAGTSIVATTFSSDTPLQVVRMVRDGGVSENWWWWSMAAGHAASVFLFASLWRRSGMVTDVELIEFRYDGLAARVLRIFDGGYQGILVGGCVVAAVSIGLSKMLAIMLGIPDGTNWGLAQSWGVEIELTTAIVFGLAIATVATSALGGLYGVTFTDLAQFAISMAGAVLLATLVAKEFGGIEPMLEAAGRHVPDASVHFGLLPDASAGGAMQFTIATWFFLAWWARAPGHGATAQRVLATRTERDGALAMLWFSVAHYALRPWPWIVVAIGSIAVLPPGTIDPEAAYPAMIDRFCGPGVKGLLVAAMIAAFMSTVDTHLNLSGAYLVNDVIDPLRRTLRGRRGEGLAGVSEDDRSTRRGRRDVLLGRLLMLPVLAIVLAVAAGVDDILAIYKFLAVMMSGSALVLILRWYWWRISAWSEIAAMVASVLVAAHVASLESLEMVPGRPDEYFGSRLAITLATSTAVWIAVTFMTPPVAAETLRRFHERVRPPGPGWAGVRDRGEPARGLAEPIILALTVTIGLWLAIVGTGEAILATATGSRLGGVAMLAVAIPCLAIPWRRIRAGRGTA